ncbi:hypothetical protein BC835DRAFT_1311482 [Cytidiella melzeri]|nr:hypothetical protein BC835DRAFT_1311482 [Cytidiella melzeri]
MGTRLQARELGSETCEITILPREGQFATTVRDIARCVASSWKTSYHHATTTPTTKTNTRNTTTLNLSPVNSFAALSEIGLCPQCTQTSHSSLNKLRRTTFDNGTINIVSRSGPMMGWLGFGLRREGAGARSSRGGPIWDGMALVCAERELEVWQHWMDLLLARGAQPEGPLQAPSSQVGGKLCKVEVASVIVVVVIVDGSIVWTWCCKAGVLTEELMPNYETVEDRPRLLYLAPRTATAGMCLQMQPHMMKLGQVHATMPPGRKTMMYLTGDGLNLGGRAAIAEYQELRSIFFIARAPDLVL